LIASGILAGAVIGALMSGAPDHAPARAERSQSIPAVIDAPASSPAKAGILPLPKAAEPAPLSMSPGRRTGENDERYEVRVEATRELLRWMDAVGMEPSARNQLTAALHDATARYVIAAESLLMMPTPERVRELDTAVSDLDAVIRSLVTWDQYVELRRVTSADSLIGAEIADVTEARALLRELGKERLIPVK
jgi:hypothetical protein